MDKKDDNQDIVFGIYHSIPMYQENVDQALDDNGSSFTCAEFREAFVRTGQAGASDTYCIKGVLQRLQRKGKIKSGGRGRPYTKVYKPGTIQEVFDIAPEVEACEAEGENTSSIRQDDAIAVIVKPETQNAGAGNSKDAVVIEDKLGNGSAPKTTEQFTGVNLGGKQSGFPGLIAMIIAWFSSVAELCGNYYARFVCFIIQLAQMAILGHFGYTLGSGNQVLQYTYVAMAVGLGLSVPVFMYRGIVACETSKKRIGMLQIVLALLLGFASFGMSASWISASMTNGTFLAKQIEDEKANLENLKREKDENQAKARALEIDAFVECENGGCGRKAKLLRFQATQYKQIALEKQNEVDKVRAETKATPPEEVLLAQAVRNTPFLGAKAEGLLPYYIATVMEIISVLGLALLWRKD
ncbi:hypothetical protein FDK21_20140 [Cohaesibacter sp. CAU 1516]|uniref:hypothetical protein n=1 Tax=Cohaesibacter sp. CAU 1516 TaxID=2576038 RepID=UPI0010FE1339|nr:hypothetical protein [Cohaesibacter sp. CAU 1516]TLP42172.1 hypothetical protein FDK21_20140 [Cohaesibacter sp. CAU 1516]